MDDQPKLKWYLIDSERTFCKIWDFIITMIIIYNLVMVPFILVFPQVYTTCITVQEKENDSCDNFHLQKIELVIDVIYFIEICFNFLKKTPTHKDLKTISKNYLLGYFTFDAVSTIPLLIIKESGYHYYLKVFRMIHIDRLTVPQYMLLIIVL